RVETEALVSQLEVIPRREIAYRTTVVPEMDVDAVLVRRPQLVLVDELAHTNAPGSRHPKRHLDVEELLAAGIDVYTTMNVQHLESLNDVVAQITGVIVREKVPDSVLDAASAIEVVDLPPPELLQRLKEGKVYIPDQAARAIQQFFRVGNLTALRELTLRRTAERVDEQMRAYMETRAIPGPWPAGERLLVCISSNPFSERLVRTARRLADELKAEWYAVYVETPGDAGLSPAKADQITRILQLAEELGAKTVTIPGQNVADAVLDYARQHNVTKIIAGKPIRSRWIEMWRGAVVDRLIQRSGNIDIYVISAEVQSNPSTAPSQWRLHRPWQRYAWSLALVAVTTAISVPIHRLISPANLVMLYLAAVVAAAIYLGRGPAILTSTLGVLAFDFFLVEPRLTLTVADTEYIFTFIGLFAVGLVISTLAARSREQAEAARRREVQAVALYELSRDLATASELDDILQVIIRHVGETFSRETAILLPAGEALQPRALSPGFSLTENESAVATWSFKQGQSAGRGTDTLSAAAVRCIPLKTARGVVGVLVVKPVDPSSHLLPEQRRLLEAFASQAALAIERAELAEQARQAQLSRAAEELQRALLNSISHDLRTPLVSITGTLSSLEEDGACLEDLAQRSLITMAREEAERLNRLVGNLLDMTRIEAGALRTTAEPCDIQEVISAALDRLGSRLDRRPVTVEAPSLLAPMDFVLMAQVLTNLLDNALKYSQPGSPIDVQARVTDGMMEISVLDRGLGVPKEDLGRIFDKFYRVQRPGGTSGTGLGLAICKGIVEAHRGRIWAQNRPGGGTIVTVALPCEPAGAPESETA
ncbi:MAG: two-component system, OmpR family, sensor histidine kinase KdpD, partial [Chloroflexota bacterium]|nr:two-component system, OmpR family, sensor histidine kinase KdpD [Chloroflexota bacterium]